MRWIFIPQSIVNKEEELLLKGILVVAAEKEVEEAGMERLSIELEWNFIPDTK